MMINANCLAGLAKVNELTLHYVDATSNTNDFLIIKQRHGSRSKLRLYVVTHLIETMLRLASFQRGNDLP